MPPPPPSTDKIKNNLHCERTRFRFFTLTASTPTPPFPRTTSSKRPPECSYTSNAAATSTENVLLRPHVTASVPRFLLIFLLLLVLQSTRLPIQSQQGTQLGATSLLPTVSENSPNRIMYGYHGWVVVSKLTPAPTPETCSERHERT